MDYRVIVSRPALADLSAIVAFLAAANRDAAVRIGHELLDACETLLVLPERGSPVRLRPALRKLSHRYYLIYYRIDGSRRLVEIVRIWDGRRDPQSLLIDRFESDPPGSCQ
jgi:plasmid stabilization system protein ParE